MFRSGDLYWHYADKYTWPIRFFSSCGKQKKKKLMDGCFGKNHILYTDTYNVSPVLSRYILEKDTSSCGTIQVEHKYWPDFGEGQQKGW